MWHMWDMPIGMGWWMAFGGLWMVVFWGGRIVLPELPANLAWGDMDWRTLYITARSSIYRLRLAVPGVAVF